MAFFKKTPLEKFQTKVKKLLVDKRFKENSKKVKFQNQVLFEYTTANIKYGYKRCFLTKLAPIVKEDFKATIILNNENFDLIGSNIINPPQPAKVIIELFRKAISNRFDTIVIGFNENRIRGNTIFITKDLYKTITSINKEESKDKAARFFNRTISFLKNSYGEEISVIETNKDYSLLLSEIIASGQINQDDILLLARKLEVGNNSDVIIKQQVHKQVEWLINSVQEIIDVPKITKHNAKDLGNKYFGFAKSLINGPEHLMELILTKYGQYTIFGAPVLLNTDKYVVHSGGLPRSQFDIILITHLSDMEVVELKNPNSIILEYDQNRNKFFASKELSIAISQAERYISAVYKQNDDEYLIDGLKIRDYINREIGGTMTVEISRPTALIVIGRYQNIAQDYKDLPDKIKRKVTNENYNKNYLAAYKELKGAHKNINITSYSELLESARTRMIINKEENINEIIE